MIALGIMSGTSCDGVDAVAIRIASPAAPGRCDVLEHRFEPYPEALRAELLRPERITMVRLAELHYVLGGRYAALAKSLACSKDAEVCGLHGQTVWHAPPSQHAPVPCTLQLGSSAVVASALGIPVVGDVRAIDVARGGEGAPIVPFAHWFFSDPDHAPRCIVNVGGIANITHVTKSMDDVRAWDVGPGMMLVDAFVERVTGGAQRFDVDGQLGAAGRVVPAVVAAGLAHPFFTRAIPKSTGREDFGHAFLDTLVRAAGDAGPADICASLVEITARGIVAAVGALAGTRELVVTGGGARNPTLRAALARLLGAATPVVVHDSGPFAPDRHEPVAMALIAARTLAGLPSSLPAVTRASSASRLGHIHWP